MPNSILFKMSKKLIEVKVFDAEEGGFYATCDDLSAYTQGNDFEDVMRNIKEALEVSLYGTTLEELGFNDDSKVRITYEINAPHA
jgi:predicted RNase H-like HicB family nuclease